MNSFTFYLKMDLKMEVLELRRKLDESQNEKTKSQRKSAKETESFSSLETQFSAAKNRIEELENQLQQNKNNNTQTSNSPFFNLHNDNQSTFLGNTANNDSILVMTSKNDQKIKEDQSKRKLLQEIQTLNNRLETEISKNEVLSATRENQIQLKLEIEDLKEQNEKKDLKIQQQSEEIVNLRFVAEKMQRWESILGRGIFEQVNDVNDLEKQFTTLKDGIKLKDEMIQENNEQISSQNFKVNELNNEILNLKDKIMEQSNEIEVLHKEKELAIVSTQSSKELLVSFYFSCFRIFFLKILFVLGCYLSYWCSCVRNSVIQVN